SGFLINEGRSIIRGTEIFPSFRNDGTTVMTWHPVLAPAGETDLVTDSVYIEHRLQLDRRWSPNLGLRVDQNRDRASSGVLVSDSSSWSPRLGVRFDPAGNGQLLLDVGYGKYVAKIHPRIANAASAAGNAAELDWTYRGPCINCDLFAPT